MRRILLLLGAAVTCEAWVSFATRRLLPVPQRVILSRGFRQRPAVEARASLGEVKDTLAEVKDFAGWVLVPPPPPLESTVVEGASHFKTICVPPDASYEEIKQQVKVLLDKYKDDSEKIAAIEVRHVPRVVLPVMMDGVCEPYRRPCSLRMRRTNLWRFACENVWRARRLPMRWSKTLVRGRPRPKRSSRTRCRSLLKTGQTLSTFRGGKS